MSPMFEELCGLVLNNYCHSFAALQHFLHIVLKLIFLLSTRFEVENEYCVLHFQNQFYNDIHYFMHCFNEFR